MRQPFGSDGSFVCISAKILADLPDADGMIGR